MAARRPRISNVYPKDATPMHVQIARWGNSLGLRVPKEIAAQVGLKAGARVEITAEDGRIIVAVASPVYTLHELLGGMTPEAMHEAFDWGPAVGREAIE
jgi:antitoxin MazE